MPVWASRVLHPWQCRTIGAIKPVAVVALPLVLIFSSVLSLSLPADAQDEMRERVIYSFSLADRCFSPLASLVADTQGDLYGTTSGGSESDPGCVFELTPDGESGWREKTIHFFDVNDGYQPVSALVFDPTGNLYGTAGSGGLYGGGVVFELTPVSGGEWADTILYNFGGPGDGVDAASQVVFGPDGNLYGSTAAGGASNCGIVYRLEPGPTPWLGWEETILHDFANSQEDGCNPRASVVFDAQGRLYGTTSGGGTWSSGTVFELTPLKAGAYRERIIHSFSGADGSQPLSTLTIDDSGNLYGTTFSGGNLPACDCGTVFELTLSGRKWLEHVLHAFSGLDGKSAAAPVILDRGGNLYTTTASGGGDGFSGLILKLAPEKNGTWRETILHKFPWPSTGDGASPYAGLTLRAGELFGTTLLGGTSNLGAVVSVGR
jgi:uncharacterized repeat protein (TIGR03803 family)